MKPLELIQESTLMKRLTALTLIFLIQASAVMKAGRYYYFEHLRTTDGLPSNTIYCSLQDSKGFMWIGTRDGLCRFDGRSFTSLSEIAPEHDRTGLVMAVAEDYNGRIWFSSSSGTGFYDPDTDESGSLGLIGNSLSFDIETDKEGNVWFASRNLYRYDTNTSEMHTYSLSDESSLIASDSLGTIWVMTKDGNVYIYDRLNDTFTKQDLKEKIQVIEPISDGKLLIATESHDICTMDCISLSTKHILSIDKSKEIRCLCEGNKGEFWIGTDNGLFIKRETDIETGSAFHDRGTPASISADYITSIDKDRSGNMWIGTYYTGLNIVKNRQEEMALFFTNPSSNSIKGEIVRSICADDEGIIWFCTEDGWLNRLDPQTRIVKNFEIVKKLNMHEIVMDNERLWVCSYGKGVYIFDIKKERTIRHYDLPSNTTTTGLKTKDGSIYIGTLAGLYRYEPDSDSFRHVEKFGTDYIHCMYQDNNEVIWIGTYGNGIFCMDKDENVLSHTFPDTGENGNGLTSRFITSFAEDSQKRIWVTTEGGGICYTTPEYDLKDLHFNNISSDDGLPSNVTCAIVEDKEGTLWVSTINGIACLSGNNLDMTALVNGSNEIAGYQYSYGAVCSSRTGIFYFGNTEGMVALTPSKMKNRAKQYDLQITRIEARNSDQVTSLKNPGKSAMHSNDIKVKHKDASAIYISFTVPEYSSRNIIYTYRLIRGKKEQFSGTTHDNEVILSGLRPGRYRFEIATMDNTDMSDGKSLSITITPHILLSKVAYIIYALICIGILGLAVLMLEIRGRNEKARQYSKLMNKKEKEIYNAKINFFTNITHEIRTPLTLIKMPLDKIMATGRYTPESEKDLKTIQANTDRLLSLTNQILDMRKMERNELKISFIQENLCSIVRTAIGLFEQMAHDQRIKMNINIPEHPVHIMCAKDSVLTIISNLLSNAVKYGKETINIIVQCEDGETAVVRVESDGEVIPENEREKIFQIFFQREGAAKEGQGTGLGLPYARNLANMHNGKLYLDGNVTEMNSFVLELPVNQKDEVKLAPSEPSISNGEKKVNDFDTSRHTLLVVEDSEEMREYLAGELTEEYNVRTAANGADALDIIRSEKIDLVVSDIMMPVMDGCELCNAIKSDSDISHIPVILLTAVVGTETRIETLEVGADGYIEKPFPIELLLSNISNLFKNKEISYRQFMNKPLTHYSSITTNKVDQEYMDKVHEFIMNHIAETDLNIENLTIQLGTSKSSLYRKLKANTGLSINEYIRLCRLKQAAELLSSQKYKINEVAFMTGFSSPSYFATCFQKQFNITPSEFVKNLGQ